VTAAHLAAGQRAEDKALAALHAAGLTLVARNYRCVMGELDLVMDDHGTLAFVEVRYRKNRRFGSAAETIGPDKQRRLTRTAYHFLRRHAKWQRRPLRFDVVALHGEDDLEWIQNAF
jgi:putative endonuclease